MSRADAHVWHALKFEHRDFMYIHNNYFKYDHLVSGLGSNKSYYVALYTEQTFRLIDVSLHTYVYFIHVYIKLSPVRAEGNISFFWENRGGLGGC